MPLTDDVKLSVQKRGAARPSLNLAARRTRDRVLPDQHDLVGNDADRRDQLAAHILEQRRIERGLVLARHLEHQDQPLAPLRRDSERSRIPCAQTRMAALGGHLDVVRVIVATVADDQILEPTRDDELPIDDHSEVARPQKAVR